MLNAYIFVEARIQTYNTTNNETYTYKNIYELYIEMLRTLFLNVSYIQCTT